MKEGNGAEPVAKAAVEERQVDGAMGILCAMTVVMTAVS